LNFVLVPNNIKDLLTWECLCLDICVSTCLFFV